MSVNMYNQVASFETALALSNRVIRSIELWMMDLLNPDLPLEQRYEAGLNAITLLKATSDQIREDLPEEEQEILIKIFGQIINGINKYIRKETKSLDKEFAGLRLIKKFLIQK